jgi:hypothetical protein
MSFDDNLKITPENFCHLSKCKYFMSEILSSGCRLDYLTEEDLQELGEVPCPLQMERSYRSNDPVWNSQEDPFEKIAEAYKKIREEGFTEISTELNEEEINIRQELYDAEIKLEKTQLKLQDFLSKLKNNK